VETQGPSETSYNPKDHNHNFRSRKISKPYQILALISHLKCCIKQNNNNNNSKKKKKRPLMALGVAVILDGVTVSR
jgi:hypothetical protein